MARRERSVGLEILEGLRQVGRGEHGRIITVPSVASIASGRVVGGRVELDSELPEGTSVIVLARDGDETFEADPETERMLLEAMAQCDRGGTVPLSNLLGELRDSQ